MKKLKKETIKYAVVKTLPVMCGYLFLGFAFGILLQKAGYHFAWAFFISLFVYAGSLQFVLVTFLTVGAPFYMVAFMSLLINFRHIFYGLSFVDIFKKMGRKYPYMIFSLTDETYSVLCSLKKEEMEQPDETRFLIAILDHSYWVTGSVLGALLGQVISFELKGVEFAMTALFTVIFVDQWFSFKSHLPALIGLVSSVVFLLLLGPDNFLLPSLIVTVTALLGCKRVLGNKTESGVV